MPLQLFGHTFSSRDQNKNQQQHIRDKTHQPNRTTVNVRRYSSSHSSNSDLSSTSSAGIPRPSSNMDHIFQSLMGKGDKDKDQEKKRHSLSIRPPLLSKDRKSSSSKDAPKGPAQLTAVIESPPLVMYGSPSTSTGALLSGRLKLDVSDPSGSVQLDTFVMQLVANIEVKKPVSKDCAECRKRVNVLKEWKFLSESKTCNKDEDNQFPFSFILPGQLPATTHTSLATIDYSLVAKAVTSKGETISCDHLLKLQRALLPGPEKTSVRIFPPTNLVGSVQVPPIIHPVGTFKVLMRLSGVVDKKDEKQHRWRLRKVIWRIEEHQKITSPACSNHQHKLGEGKALQNAVTRDVAWEEIKSGWKTDFDTASGEINLEFDAALNPSKHPLCDVDSPAGVEVKHNLVIELVVGEEFCFSKTTKTITPTGVARVLKMQFNLNVTERGGLGISWDQERPPNYDDVPDSPPGYKYADHPGDECTITDYVGEEIPYEDLEIMRSDNPEEPARYRERTPVLGPVGGESSQTPQISSPRNQRRTASSSSSTAMSPRTQLMTPRMQAHAAAAARGSAILTAADLVMDDPPPYSLNNPASEANNGTTDNGVESWDVGSGDAA